MSFNAASIASLPLLIYASSMIRWYTLHNGSWQTYEEGSAELAPCTLNQELGEIFRSGGGIEEGVAVRDLAHLIEDSFFDPIFHQLGASFADQR